MRMLRCNDLVSLQVQSADKCLLQFGQEMKRTAEKCDMSADGLTAGKAADGLIDNCLENRGRQIFASCTLIDERRMKEGGQLIVAVEPDPAQAQMKLQTVRTPDGKIWWSAFTSFEEELKGADQVKSTFLSEIGRMFEAALTVPEVAGIIINPWNRTLMLDKTLIRIVLGDVTQ